MIKKIVTDIGGVLVPEQWSKTTLMEDFRQNGAAYVQRATKRDLEVIEAIKQRQGFRTAEEAVQFAYQQIAQKVKDPLYLELMSSVNLAGLEEGRVQASFYPDVKKFLLYKQAEIGDEAISTFSNGSNRFQRAMFRSSNLGDLSGAVTFNFDTARIGRKTDTDSYKKISNLLKEAPEEIQYLDDDETNIEAAYKANLLVCLVDRTDTRAGCKYPRTTQLI